MQRKDSRSLIDDPAIVERSLVLALLDDDHDAWWTRAELEREHHDVQPLALGDAPERLRDGEAVELSGERVRATKCARHLDGLGMICA